MTKEQLNSFLEEIKFLKELPEEELFEIYIENKLDYAFKTIDTEDLLNDYIKNIVYLYNILADLVTNEEFEFAAKLKEAIQFEQDEFSKMVKLYHKSKLYSLDDIQEAIKLINITTKENFL